MKTITMAAVALIVTLFGAVSGAHAQDGAYSYYGAQVPRTIPVDPADRYYMSQSARQYQYDSMPTRGGRDPRGGFYGRPTVWPGDYRDALDRGSWPTGNRAVVIAPHRQWPD